MGFMRKQNGASQGSGKLALGAVLIILLFAALLIGAFIFFTERQKNLAQTVANGDGLLMSQSEGASGTPAESSEIQVTPKPTDRYAYMTGAGAVPYYKDGQTSVFFVEDTDLVDVGEASEQSWIDNMQNYFPYQDIFGKIASFQDLFMPLEINHVDMFLNVYSSETAIEGWFVVLEIDPTMNLILHLSSYNGALVGFQGVNISDYWYFADEERYHFFVSKILTAIKQSYEDPDRQVGSSYGGYLNLDDTENEG